ncbi:hypothetical protein GCM10027176_74290 [Actinoallomurus bryophytorum]
MAPGAEVAARIGSGDAVAGTGYATIGLSRWVNPSRRVPIAVGPLWFMPSPTSTQSACGDPDGWGRPDRGVS